MAVWLAGPAFELASLLQAPMLAALSAATARAMVTRADVLTHLWDPGTGRVNHVPSRIERTPWGLRSRRRAYPTHTLRRITADKGSP